MKKLWEFFWFVMACFVAGSIMLAMVEPYIPVIVGLVLLVSVGFIVFRVYGTLATRRRHF